MLIKVQSHRGDHNCLLEGEVAERMFDKLTGRIEAPLGDEVKEAIPETFQELDALFRRGRLSYLPVRKDADGETVLVDEFDPALEGITFIAPVRGG